MGLKVFWKIAEWVFFILFAVSVFFSADNLYMIATTGIVMLFCSINYLKEEVSKNARPKRVR